MSLWLSLNEKMRVLVSPLSVISIIPMIYTLNLHVFINLGTHFISYPPLLMFCAFIANFFDHDVNSCLYYDIFDECYDTLNGMI